MSNKKAKCNFRESVPQRRAFVNPKLIAQRLGITTHGVRKALVEGRLPGQKVLGRWYMRREDFLKLPMLSSATPHR